MIDKQFDKETFKKSVKDNVKFLYRRKLEEATQEQLFQAVSYTVNPAAGNPQVFPFLFQGMVYLISIRNTDPGIIFQKVPGM